MRGRLDSLRSPRSRSKAPRILLIDDYLPDRSIGAGIPRMAELLRAMSAAGAKVTLWPVFERSGGAQRPDLYGARVAGSGLLARLIGFVFRKVKGVDAFHRARFRRFLERRAASFDGIIVSRPHNMRIFRALVKQPPAIAGVPPVLYDAEALYAEREIMMREILGEPLAAQEARRILGAELDLATDAQIVVTVNQSSAEAFTMAGHGDVRILGHSVAPRPTPQSFERRDGFLFVGPTRIDNEPNSDAVVWFADRVLPLLRAKFGRDVSLMIVGMTGAPTVLARAAAGLDLRGVLPDLSDVYSRARVFLAPTRFAAGIPLKVYDAAAHGVPTVITPILARSIGWVHEREALVASTPEEFAAACQRLHEDRALWERVRSSALERVQEDCSVNNFDRTVAALLNSIADRRRSGAIH
jgi:glycosyltransferase involved in cell wall biosynthesis